MGFTINNDLINGGLKVEVWRRQKLQDDVVVIEENLLTFVNLLAAFHHKQCGIGIFACSGLITKTQNHPSYADCETLWEQHRSRWNINIQ